MDKSSDNEGSEAEFDYEDWYSDDSEFWSNTYISTSSTISNFSWSSLDNLWDNFQEWLLSENNIY